jgi:hypothetical protein
VGGPRHRGSTRDVLDAARHADARSRRTYPTPFSFDMSVQDDGDKPWFICLGCDRFHSRTSAPNPIQVSDFWFCSLQCHTRWINEGRPGMS